MNARARKARVIAAAVVESLQRLEGKVRARARATQRDQETKT
jgi:hypothetical protein